MKTSRLPPAVLAVFGISFLYWVYLAATKSFSADLIGYKELGGIFCHQGLIGYVKTGLHREPLYPLQCALAMAIEIMTGMTFTHVMAGFSVLILMATQILMYVILRELNIRTWVCALALLYWAISMTITNSAFNILLFCEITTYPLVLGGIMAGFHGLKAAGQNHKNSACGWGIVTGVVFALLTLVKAIFECIFPLYLVFFAACHLVKNKASMALVFFLAAAGVMFYAPVIGYKCLNRAYNGNFAVADRGPVNLYGNVARRVGPLTLRKYLSNLAFVTDTCKGRFKPDECAYWDFNVSDDLGDQKAAELAGQHLTPQAVTDNLLRLSKEKALRNLPQYILLTATEGLRVLFWDASTGALHYIMALLTCVGVLYCFLTFNALPGLLKHAFGIIFLFVCFSSLFAILPRHILPIVPLYLITISHVFQTAVLKV